MNVLWEVVFAANRQGIPMEAIRFRMPDTYSAYMEVANSFLNQDWLEGREVEINPYYRFGDVFQDLFQPENDERRAFGDSLMNLILHQLAENDVLSGMTREEYYKKLLLRDIAEGKHGILAKEALELFTNQEQQRVLSGILRQYKTGVTLDLFREMMATIMPECIVYQSNENPREILIYVGKQEDEAIEKKLQFLIAFFLDLRVETDIYYEYHFGMIGVECTMVTDEIMIC